MLAPKIVQLFSKKLKMSGLMSREVLCFPCLPGRRGRIEHPRILATLRLDSSCRSITFFLLNFLWVNFVSFCDFGQSKFGIDKMIQYTPFGMSTSM